MNEYSAVIGRFQPFHIGHLKMVRKALDVAEKCIICVGSSQKGGSFNDPLTFEQRRDLIVNSLNENGIMNDRYIIIPVPDREKPADDEGWGHYLTNIILSATHITPDLWVFGSEERREHWRLPNITIDREETPVSASQIRQLVFEAKYDEAKELIPCDENTKDLIINAIYDAESNSLMERDCFIWTNDWRKNIRGQLNGMIDFLNEELDGCIVEINMSGGKDSTIACGILKQVVGADRIRGHIIPQGYMHDIDAAIKACESIGIQYDITDIQPIMDLIDALERRKHNGNLSYVHSSNCPARVRTMLAYSDAAIDGVDYPRGGRVAGTCNYTENLMSYATKGGDALSDIAIFDAFTVSEVKAMGVVLRLPLDLVFKTPEDGLSGKTDEDNLGMLYKHIDEYIFTGKCESLTEENVNKIERSKVNGAHKLHMAKFYIGQEEKKRRADGTSIYL